MDQDLGGGKENAVLPAGKHIGNTAMLQDNISNGGGAGEKPHKPQSTLKPTCCSEYIHGPARHEKHGAGSQNARWVLIGLNVHDAKIQELHSRELSTGIIMLMTTGRPGCVHIRECA